ncbi:MAG: hypothetical protein JO202_09965 [Ktedonobacteraceae bacterium]|nr:hypothetical protein [Ktedonobacteraceae bacterium]
MRHCMTTASLNVLQDDNRPTLIVGTGGCGSTMLYSYAKSRYAYRFISDGPA